MSYKIPHYSLRLVKEKTVTYACATVESPTHADVVLTKLIGSRDTEHMSVLMLDGRNGIIGSTIVAIGGMHGMMLRPRDLFKAAIVANASALIMGHNHPSGDPSPSAEDAAFTAKIIEASRVLGIPVVDHVIVTKTGRSFSFLDHGLMGDR